MRVSQIPHTVYCPSVSTLVIKRKYTTYSTSALFGPITTTVYSGHITKYIHTRRLKTDTFLLHSQMARKLHATMGGVKPRHDLVTIALVPAEGEDEAVSSVLASKLQHELSKFGPTLVLDENTARHVFQDKTIDATKLHNAFYRSKLTGWMAAQEENFRFILLRADAAASAWSQVRVGPFPNPGTVRPDYSRLFTHTHYEVHPYSRLKTDTFLLQPQVCVSQADRVVVVARVTRESGASEEDDETIFWGKRNTGHEKDDRETEVAKRGAPSRAERRLLWRRRAGASVELVLVHDPGVAPMVRPYAFPKSRHTVLPKLVTVCPYMHHKVDCSARLHDCLLIHITKYTHTQDSRLTLLVNNRRTRRGGGRVARK